MLVNLFKRRMERLFAQDESQSNWKFYLGLSIAAGLVAVAMHAFSGFNGYQFRELSAGFFLSGASLFVGILLGFIFGIPKTAIVNRDQSDSVEADVHPSYSPNTNLEEVSDWLTKMLIGVGLVQLSAIPGYLKRFASYWQISVGNSFPAAYVAVIVVFFVCVGFLMGYLWTRLTLIEDFIDKDPRRKISMLIDEVGMKTKADPGVINRPLNRQVVSPQERRTAEAIAKISSSSKLTISDLKQQIGILAAKYETIRATMDSGDERTREMEIIASQMRGYALAAYDLLPGYAASKSAGERLAAIAFLETRPDDRYFEWMVERFRLEVPFMQYHTAIAMRSALQQGSSRTDRKRLVSYFKTALGNALQSVAEHDGNEASDEIRILKECLQRLEAEA